VSQALRSAIIDINGVIAANPPSLDLQAEAIL